MKCIVNGKVLLKDSIACGVAVIFDDKIQKLVSADSINPADYDVIDAEGNYVSPGLVDMHIHGYMGADVADGHVDGIKLMAESIVKNGVTSWCPATMTVSVPELEAAYDAVREIKNSPDYYGAKIIGVNSEGPFLNVAKKGAQAEEHIIRPDARFIIKHSDIIKLYTIAPEVDGATECIEEVAASTDVVASMGHTVATYEEAMEGIRKGVKSTTHLFNAMSALSHRSPGVVGAALSGDVSVELIADTFHVSKDLYNLVARLKGDKLCLVTDCIRPGGMPDGDYYSGGLLVHKKGIQCTLDDGTIAGSVLNLNEGVFNLYRNSELELYEAANCASLNPAKTLGVDESIGSIEVGKCADMIIADENFCVLKTIIDGEIRYHKGE